MTTRRWRTYFTGLVTDLHDLRGHPRTIVGTGWIATFKATATTKTFHQGREVIISAPSWVAAQRALNLIRAGLVLLHGAPMLFGADESLIARNKKEPEVRDRDIFEIQRSHGFKVGLIGKACLLAARASTRLEWHYAVIKYRFSVGLYGPFVVDLEPYRSRHLALSRFPDDHVMLSHAILAGYKSLSTSLPVADSAQDTRPGLSAARVQYRCTRGRDQWPRKKRQRPEGLGGSSPTSCCGGQQPPISPISKMLSFEVDLT